MMAVPTLAIGCSLLIVTSSTPAPVPSASHVEATRQVVAPAVGRVRLEPPLDHVDRHVEAHDAQRHGDRGGHVVEGTPVAHGAGEDEVSNPGAQIVADDAGEILEEDPLGRVIVEAGRLEPRQPVEVDRRVGDPPPFELLGDLGGDGRLAAPVDTGDDHTVHIRGHPVQHRTNLAVTMTSMDWVDWHAAYDDPGSGISRRLPVVRRRIGERLDEATGPTRILSLSAGSGRDLLPELAARPALVTTAVLIELDPRLAEDARRRAAGLRGVSVRQADAGDPAAFADVLPVDLLLLCGIFGNISEADIRATVDAVPSMLAPAGTVIWTRGRYEGNDLRPVIRRWFTDAGLLELAFDGEPDRFGVGVARAARRRHGRSCRRASSRSRDDFFSPGGSERA